MGFRNLEGTGFECCGDTAGIVAFPVKKTKLGSVMRENEGHPIFDGVLLRGDCYIILCTQLKKRQSRVGSPFNWTVFTWRGSKASALDYATCGNRALSLQQKLVVNGTHRDCVIGTENEGSESDEFKDIMGVQCFEYMEGSSAVVPSVVKKAANISARVSKRISKLITKTEVPTQKDPLLIDSEQHQTPKINHHVSTNKGRRKVEKTVVALQKEVAPTDISQGEEKNKQISKSRKSLHKSNEKSKTLGRKVTKSLKMTLGGFENMKGSEFEGCGNTAGVVIFHIVRGRDLERVEESDGVYSGMFYNDDCYLILHSVLKTEEQLKTGGSELEWRIFTWKGINASFIEAGLAGTKANVLFTKLVSNGNFYDCKIVKTHQDDEPEELISCLQCSKLTCQPGKRQAKAAPLASKKFGALLESPKMFEVTLEHLRRIPIDIKVLQDNICYILDTGNQVYSFAPSNVGRVLTAYAEEMARRRCKWDYKKAVKPVHLKSASSSKEIEIFYQLLEDLHQEFQPYQEMRCPVLYRVEDNLAVEVAVSDYALIDSTLMDPGSVYILDCISEVYLWCGKNTDPLAKLEGAEVAQRMIDEDENTRPTFLTVDVIRACIEPVYFKERFFGFDDSDMLEVGGAHSPSSTMTRTNIERRLSQEVKRVRELWEFEENKDLKLTEDESATLKSYTVESDGTIASVSTDHTGILSSGMMYLFVFSCKANSRHLIFTWEGSQSSVALRTTAGIIMPTLLSELGLSGTQTQYYMQQGKETDLFLRILATQQRMLLVYRGAAGGGYLRNTDQEHLGFKMSNQDRIHVFQVSNYNNEKYTRVNEVHVPTLQARGMHPAMGYVFLRLKKNENTATIVRGGLESFNSDKLIRCLENVYDGKIKVSANEAKELNLKHMPNILTCYPTRRIRLFEVSYDLKQVGGLYIQEISDFSQSDLKSNRCFLLDTGTTNVYGWYGDDTLRLEQLELVADVAIWYGTKALDKPVNIALVDRGFEPNEFISCFAEGWRDFANRKKQGLYVELLQYRLDSALALADMADSARYELEHQPTTKPKDTKSRRIRPLTKTKVVKFIKGSVISVTDKLGSKVELGLRQSLHFKNVGKSLKINQEVCSVDAVLEDIRSGKVDWTLYRYNGLDEIIFCDSGLGGAEAAQEALNGDEIQYCLLNVKSEHLDKMMMVYFVPDTMSPKLRGLVNIHRAPILDVFGPFNSETTIRETEELTNEFILSLIS